MFNEQGALTSRGKRAEGDVQGAKGAESGPSQVDRPPTFARLPQSLGLRSLPCSTALQDHAIRASSRAKKAEEAEQLGEGTQSRARSGLLRKFALTFPSRSLSSLLDPFHALLLSLRPLACREGGLLSRRPELEGDEVNGESSFQRRLGPPDTQHLVYVLHRENLLVDERERLSALQGVLDLAAVERVAREAGEVERVEVERRGDLAQELQKARGSARRCRSRWT